MNFEIFKTAARANADGSMALSYQRYQSATSVEIARNPVSDGEALYRSEKGNFFTIRNVEDKPQLTPRSEREARMLYRKMNSNLLETEAFPAIEEKRKK